MTELLDNMKKAIRKNMLKNGEGGKEITNTDAEDRSASGELGARY